MVAGPGIALLALGLAACGSSSPSVNVAAPAPAPSASAGPPGTIGQIAQLSAGSMEVQNANTGQVTVTFTASTRFSEQQKAALSSIKTGDCLTANGTPAAGGNGLTARTVVLSSPVNGSCTGNRGGGFGFPGAGGGGGGRRNGATPRPSAGMRNGGGGGNNANLNGQVTAIAGSTVTVSGILRTGGGARPSGAPSAHPLALTVDSTTQFTREASVTSSALKVGECVVAAGTSNDIGDIQATSIGIFPAGANGCSFGRGPGAARSGGTNG